MRTRFTCLLMVAGLVVSCARYASASPATVTNEKEAVKEFKAITKISLSQFKSEIKTLLASIKTEFNSIKSQLKAGTLDPFTAAPLIIAELESNYISLSTFYQSVMDGVDLNGSNFIQQINTFFPGVRHGQGGDLDKFLAAVQKELDKFTKTVAKELSKFRKDFAKNPGSFTNITFISTVHPFPRSFDPTPSNDGGSLQGEFQDAWLLGIAVIDAPTAGTPRQDVYVIGISSSGGTGGEVTVQFYKGDASSTNVGPPITGISPDATSGIFSESLINHNESVPIFADGFESGNTSAWSNTVP